MTEKSICICDEDPAYVQAFSSYLMENIPGISICSFTSKQAFLECGRSFQIGILSKDFLSVLEFSAKDIVEEKFYLCEDEIAPEFEHLPMVYKYQSMEIVEEMIRQHQKKQETGSWRGVKSSNSAVYGIYSPICHELQMPFALSLCQIFREKGSVLFLDLEDLSILKDMVKQPEGKNLMDLLYLLVQPGERLPEMSEFICSFMGIDYIPSFHNPQEFNEVSRELWQAFLSHVLSLEYDYVVILFGRTMEGFIDMVTCCRELMVLNKPGDYYQMSQRHFLRFMEDSHIATAIETVLLPMSAGNLVEGTYALEELIQGNLGLFVRKQMKMKLAAAGR